MKCNVTKNVIFLVAGLLVIPLSARAQISASVPASTAQVWAHHIEAWQSRDLAGIMVGYSDESVDLVLGKSYHGKREITGLFSKLFSIFRAAKNHVVDTAVIEGKVVHLACRFRQ